MLNLTGPLPILTVLPTLAPIGKVTLFLSSAFQFIRMFGDMPTSQVWGRKREIKYWILVWLVSGRLSSPAYDNHCWGKMPAIHFLVKYPITPAGPNCHFP